MKTPSQKKLSAVRQAAIQFGRPDVVAACDTASDDELVSLRLQTTSQQVFRAVCAELRARAELRGAKGMPLRLVFGPRFTGYPRCGIRRPPR